MKVDGKITIGTLWNLTYPLIIAIIFLFMSIKFNFSYNLTKESADFFYCFYIFYIYFIHYFHSLIYNFIYAI